MSKTSTATITSTTRQTALGSLEKKLAGGTPDDSVVPGTVKRSVRLMLAGAGLTLVVGVFWVVVSIIDRNAFTNGTGKKLSASQFSGGVAEVFVVEFLLPIVLWVVMARFNRAGAKWARIAASVLCAIATWLAYGLINSLHAGQTITVLDIVYIVLDLTTWIVGIISIALLWRSQSSSYFNERAAARQ